MKEYPGGLRVNVHVDAQSVHQWLLPTVVLPELRENAVKHNDFSADNPLQIEVRLAGDRLTVFHDDAAVAGGLGANIAEQVI